MKVKVLYFATLRDRAGKPGEHVELSGGATVADLKQHVIELHPELEPGMDTVLASIDKEFAFPEDEIPDGAEVALFPPVSGGSAPEHFEITKGELDLNQLVDRLVTPETGAVCAFTGVVRGRTERGDPHDTDHLYYEAYSEMAESKMRQVAAEIREKWPSVVGIAVVQRIGKLEPGTPTVLIACSAGHRDTGVFEAARYGIDRLKEIVPIWKKEVGPDGETWVEGAYTPDESDRNE
jgi:molybdopterin converting factor subunit 1